MPDLPRLATLTFVAHSSLAIVSGEVLQRIELVALVPLAMEAPEDIFEILPLAMTAKSLQEPKALLMESTVVVEVLIPPLVTVLPPQTWMVGCFPTLAQAAEEMVQF